MTLSDSERPAAQGAKPGNAELGGDLMSMVSAQRQSQLGAVLERVAAARNGEGCSILVTGAPGSGKTRLADELCRWAEGEGTGVLWATCEAPPDVPSLWPWVQLLRDYLHLHEDGVFAAGLKARMDEVIVMLPGIEEVLRGSSVPEMGEGQALRFRLWDAIARVLTRASEDNPLLLILDALQNADAASLALLEHMATSLRGSRVLLVALARPLSPRDPAQLRAAVEALAGAPGSLTVQLTAADPVDARQPSAILSAREAEVAALIAVGFTNRKIGEKLFISERTAENHVQNILNKLGFSARTQIAAWYERTER